MPSPLQRTRRGGVLSTAKAVREHRRLPNGRRAAPDSQRGMPRPTRHQWRWTWQEGPKSGPSQARRQESWQAVGLVCAGPTPPRAHPGPQPPAKASAATRSLKCGGLPSEAKSFAGHPQALIARPHPAQTQRVRAGAKREHRRIPPPLRSPRPRPLTRACPWGQESASAPAGTHACGAAPPARTLCRLSCDPPGHARLREHALEDN